MGAGRVLGRARGTGGFEAVARQLVQDEASCCRGLGVAGAEIQGGQDVGVAFAKPQEEALGERPAPAGWAKGAKAGEEAFAMSVHEAPAVVGAGAGGVDGLRSVSELVRGDVLGEALGGQKGGRSPEPVGLLEHHVGGWEQGAGDEGASGVSRSGDPVHPGGAEVSANGLGKVGGRGGSRARARGAREDGRSERLGKPARAMEGGLGGRAERVLGQGGQKGALEWAPMATISGWWAKRLDDPLASKKRWARAQAKGQALA